MWWQTFSCESEAFFSWICDSKRDLEDVSRTFANLDDQIHAVEVNRQEIEENRSEFSKYK